MSMIISSKHRNLTTNKREQYNRIRYQHEYKKFVSSSEVSSNLLEQLGECYSSININREETFQETIWQHVSKLNHLIFCKEWSTFRRSKVLKELYDHFFRLEINRCVSRPNFDVCIKLCCGESCKPGSAKERSVLLASEAVFKSFDSHHQGMINWRLFLFYLHFLSEPTLSCEEQLRKAFIVISSSDGLDAEISNGVDLQDLATILFPLVKSSSMDFVLSALDEAWALVNVSGNKQVNNTTLSLNLFDKMLNQMVIKRLFARTNSSWGRGAIFPVPVCRWEEEFYNITLLNAIKRARLEQAVKEKLGRDVCRKRRQVFQCWLEIFRHQTSLRNTVRAMNYMVTMNMKSRGHRALTSWKIKQLSACDIQRIGRGFLGRIKARIWLMMNESATLIQTHSRMYLARMKLHQLLSVYTSAVIKVQSLIRGVLARRLALRRIMTLVEKARMDNANKMKRYAWERGVWCLTMLQSHSRRKNAVTLVNQLRQQRRREAEVRHAMDSRNAAFRRERKLYQRQLEEFYRQMRDDQDTKKQNEAKILQDKIRLRTLQRRLKNEEIKSQEPDKVLEENLATDNWKRDWLAKIEVAVARTRDHYAHCLDRPANRSEKKTRSIARKRIKHRVTEVLARADSKNIPMERNEAGVIARKEILHMIGEEERARLHDQMNKAFTKREHDKEMTRIKDETAEREAQARAKVYAVSVLSAACRRWLARKRVVERYEKKYDGEYHAFYYVNKQSGDVSWTKPKAIGNFDIPVKDEWTLLRDLHNFPYYFNASKIEMRWIPPPNVEICGGTVEHSWWLEHPVRTGPCPNFAHDGCLNEADGIRYCKVCFDRLTKTVKLKDQLPAYHTRE